MLNKIYDRLDQLPYYTPFGWAVIFAVIFLLVPLLLGCTTMDHTDNWHLAHKVCDDFE